MRTRAAFTGLASGSAILIKCQVVRADGWIMDYISKQTSIPASKSAWWVYDYYVAGNRRFGGVVPSWWGANF